MRTSTAIILAAAALMSVNACDGDSNSLSSQKVTQGVPEAKFPYVVRISADDNRMCTGSFISDRVLLTAAHCVSGARVIAWNNFLAGRGDVFISPGWPSTTDQCSLPRLTKDDLALVRFPPGTYKGDPGRLLVRPAMVGESFKIVGYGHNLVAPYDKFCFLPEKSAADGLCHIVLAVRNGGTDYDYTPVMKLMPETEQDIFGCPIYCAGKALRGAFADGARQFNQFVDKYCAGAFQNRGYLETGSGVKRSGTNQIKFVEAGAIGFSGGLGSGKLGLDVASSAGDSGGPLLILENGEYQIAAITHGGGLVMEEDNLRKLSIYVDIGTKDHLRWLRRVTSSHGLVVRGLGD